MVGRELALLAVAAMAAACSFDSSAVSGGDGGATIDAGVDGSPDAMVTPGDHVLLTEVKTAPDRLEFIEIYNPTCSDVDLSTYYLTDQPTYPLLPSWGDSPPLPGLLNAVVRFPADTVLASGAVTVVARDGAAFAAEFGLVARFALLNPGGSEQMEFIVYQTEPDMVIANSGDPIALFEWDGESDLVRDVDVVMAGEAPATARRVVAKQDLAPEGVDGPDADTIGTLYLPDAASLPPMAARNAIDGSYQRIAFETGFEIASGGNGLEGHDETSEDTTTTWEQEPGSQPTPGEVPQSLSVSCIGPGS
jgi:hypothetical protein